MTKKEVTKILIIEDDLKLSSLLEQFFIKNNFFVKVVGNSEQADKNLLLEHFHIIILDLMLPGEDGISICKRLRKEGNTTPIIMLTAKGNSQDIITGLDSGSDDYIQKPCDPRELLARVNAIMRRQNTVIGAPSLEEKELVFGKLNLNLVKRELYIGENLIELTSGEFAVLKLLMSNPRVPFSRDKLMHLARGKNYVSMARVIDVQISRLRKMIEENPSKPKYIQTVWGLGYVFIPES